jgi:hypothetical protein
VRVLRKSAKSHFSRIYRLVLRPSVVTGKADSRLAKTIALEDQSECFLVYTGGVAMKIRKIKNRKVELYMVSVPMIDRTCHTIYVTKKQLEKLHNRLC